jgi:hypothetical protein
VPKPAALSWEADGSLYVASATATSAVETVGMHAGDVIAVSAAAGGVGSIAVQLRRAGATVLAIAFQWVGDTGPCIENNWGCEFNYEGCHNDPNYGRQIWKLGY